MAPGAGVRVTRLGNARTRKAAAPGEWERQGDVRGAEGPSGTACVLMTEKPGAARRTASPRCGAGTRAVTTRGGHRGPRRGPRTAYPGTSPGPIGTSNPGGGQAPAGRASRAQCGPVGPGRSRAGTNCSEDSRESRARMNPRPRLALTRTAPSGAERPRIGTGLRGPERSVPS